MTKKNPKAAFFFDKAGQWQKEFKRLRTLLLDTDLAEEVKWGCACYTLNDRNVVLIHGFKEYCALLFFKGALLQDPHGALIRQTENVQGARQLRFTSLRDITAGETTIKTYVAEAVDIEKSGAKVTLKKPTDFPIPEEFQKKLGEHPALQAAFTALTPGRQRGYLLHFSSAKQSATRESRIEKNMQRILEGKGLDDD